MGVKFVLVCDKCSQILSEPLIEINSMSQKYPMYCELCYKDVVRFPHLKKMLPRLKAKYREDEYFEYVTKYPENVGFNKGIR